MNHRRVRSRSPSKKSKMKRSPKTKQKSLTRKSQRMKTKRSSTRRKSPLLIVRSLKKRLSSRSSLKKKSPMLIVRSLKKSSRQINNNDDGRKNKKSRHRKEVHYQQPLVPNYKIIRNKNTSYYEKKEDEEENYYNHRPFSYAPVPINSGYSAPSMILPPDDNKIPPESSLAVVLENENKIKRNDNIRLIMPRRNTRSKMLFKKNHNKISTKLFLDDRDIKTIERKVAKDYKKGKFKTYDELPVNVKERLSEKKYYNIFKKVEKKYSVPEVETENNNSEKEVESVVEETTINEPTNEDVKIGVEEQVAPNNESTSSETI